jgi:hypothetical protein
MRGGANRFTPSGQRALSLPGCPHDGRYRRLDAGENDRAANGEGWERRPGDRGLLPTLVAISAVHGADVVVERRHVHDVALGCDADHIATVSPLPFELSVAMEGVQKIVGGSHEDAIARGRGLADRPGQSLFPRDLAGVQYEGHEAAV